MPTIIINEITTIKRIRESQKPILSIIVNLMPILLQRLKGKISTSALSTVIFGLISISISAILGFIGCNGKFLNEIMPAKEIIGRWIGM